MTTSTNQLERPYDFLEVWGKATIANDAMPSPETLKEAVDALHGVYEFVVMRIAEAVEAVAGKREPHAVSYEDVGRLLIWVDKIRSSCAAIDDQAAKVAVLAHEPLAASAAGVGTDDPLADPEWFEELRRAHGLDMVMR